MKKTSYFSLFFSFFKIGLFTFGGGISMLPMLERECVINHSWATKEELLNYFSIGQCTPGIIAVNTATFIGYKTRGIIGALVTTLGIIFPSFVIIILISSLLDLISENHYVLKAMSGIKISICAILTVSVFRISVKTLKSISSVCIALLVIAIEIIFKISPIYIVFFTLVYSFFIFYFFKKR